MFHRSCSVLVLATALSGFALAQASAPTPAPALAFDVVSIKPTATSTRDHVNAGVMIDGAQVRINSLTLRDFIRVAYRIKLYQVAGDDAALDAPRWDIAATLPEGATRDQVPEMLQTMLAARFGLTFHHDTQQLPVYALKTTSNFGLKPSVPAAELPDTTKAPVDAAASGSAQGLAINYGNGSGYRFADNQFTATHISMAVLATGLARFLDRPVVDETGLKDGYDLTLPVTPEDSQILMIRLAVNAGVPLPLPAMRMLDGATTDSLFQSLGHLGLKLEPTKSPVERLVVDKIAATPTAN